ncbi:MAG TPA: UDP-N-acetylmuramoyl-L-alanyl-D-glutamate--2,6-diaminopimelate ligase, partial [Alphaproteobacteria bacterium]|nr:UDP-N-acetylmuramoyl-L-alanyl-D-glutamate--2,6-diaminopimelate ligase [Alphaproteobacteria bacterium]
MRLSDLIQENHAASAIEILGLSADSRAVQPGYLFAALAGTERDGAAYIDSAIEHGAVAVLTAPDVSVPSKAVHVVVDNNPRRRLALLAARFYARQPRMIAAVTGTNGKTSVAWFVRQIWETLGYKAASIGTLGAIASGFPEQPSLTTPEPVTLHHTLSQFAEAGIDHAVLEASSHGLAQYRLDGVRISAAAFTNLTRDHLDYHRSEEEYFYAKKRLFAEVMPPGRTAVVNADSPYASDIEALCWARGNRIITYGESSKDLVLVAVKPHGLGQDMTVEYKGERYEIHLPLAGRFQAMNALASAGLVLATTGMPVERVFAALDALKPVPGRLELVARHPNGAPIFVDYAHTPDGLENCLTALKPYADGRLVVVFGCGGDRDDGKRPLMGAVAARLAGEAYITDDNPRREDPAAIRAQIREACPGGIEIGDRRKAIGTAIRELAPGDVLVI